MTIHVWMYRGEYCGLGTAISANWRVFCKPLLPLHLEIINDLIISCVWDVGLLLTQVGSLGVLRCERWWADRWIKLFICIVAWVLISCVAISQRDVSSRYPHLISVKDQLPAELMNFFTAKLSKKFSVKNCEYPILIIYSMLTYICNCVVDPFDVYRSGQVRRHC